MKIWSHALWSTVEGSRLLEPDEAPEKNPASSYHGCDLGVSHWKTLYCHSIHKAAVIVLSVACNTGHGLCCILSKPAVQLNSLRQQYFPPPDCVKSEIVMSALTQHTRVVFPTFSRKAACGVKGPFN